ncbi:MAG: GAF domain-containing protein, partial [Acidobacteria bacterium]|nr:GAF domain-containing protein [Acidobacteriota bacterium]
MNESPKLQLSNEPVPGHRQPTAWLEMIDDLSHRLSLTIEPSEICWVAVRMIAEALEVEKGLVLLSNEPRQELVGQTPAYGLDPPAVQFIRLSVKEGTIMRSLWERGEPWVIQDLASDPRFEEYRSWSQSLSIHSALAFALQAGQRRRGALMVANKRSGERFNQNDVALFRVLTDQTSIALNHAEILNTQRREARRGKTLAQTASLLHATLDQQEVMKIAAIMMVGAVGGDRCHLFLVQDLAPTPALSVARDGGQQWKISETVDDDRARWLREQWESFDHDRVTIIEDVFLSPIVPSTWTTQFGIKTLVLTPLRAKKALVGYMMMEFDQEIRHFENGEMAFIEAIADQSALALHNAQAHSAMRKELEPLTASAMTYPPLVEGAGA